jgi:acyl dehydratase
MKIQVGNVAKSVKVFDKNSVLEYAKLTGDYNPVHFDENYAKKTIFKKPIVHGPYVLTLVTTLFANELPGPGSVYLSHDVKYLLPVYHDDEITARLEVIEINHNNHVFIKTTCVNQNGKIVLSGIARLKKY